MCMMTKFGNDASVLDILDDKLGDQFPLIVEKIISRGGTKTKQEFI